MDKVEKLMSSFPQLRYIFDKRMPDGQKGLYIDRSIYLNPRQPKKELVGIIAEKISHYLTSSGNITNQRTIESRKQERKARDIGNMLAISPIELVECFKFGCTTIWDCADYLQISLQTLQEALDATKKSIKE